MLTLGSLFDGIGGWQLAAVHNDVKPLWSSEIEKFPLAVTKEHFPETMQLGDITKIDGAKVKPVDIICAGSPCQDLSVAGKQEGLGGERSGLFYRAIDLVRQMRFATRGEYPKFFVWENVPGAFSSNKGMDFRAVLEEITETKIPMPKSGKWATAGMVRSSKCEVAWRVLDAQYWGVPQRRKRIFLVADFRTNRRCADKILFESKGLPRHTSESGAERKSSTDRVENGVRKASVYENHANDSRITRCDNVSTTISARCGTGGNNLPLVVYGIGRDALDRGENAADFGMTINENISPSIVARGAGAVMSNTTICKLTPLECERLQGLPDNFTLIDDKTCSDSARYKALGNGMAQPCADWIIKRIVEVVRHDEPRKIHRSHE